MCNNYAIGRQREEKGGSPGACFYISSIGRVADLAGSKVRPSGSNYKSRTWEAGGNPPPFPLAQIYGWPKLPFL